MDIEQLVLRAQSGDTEAFLSLIIQQKDSYVKDQNEALEAIQETTYHAYMNIKKLKQAQYFNTWLIRMLINYCIDVRAGKKRFLPLFSLQQEKEVPQFNHKITLELALERLNPKYQHVIILKYFQGLTLKEIAEVLEQPEGTIKTWLYKALKELRTIIDAEGGYEYA